MTGAFLAPALGQQSIRLAIVPKTPEAGPAADLLTAEFSRAGKVKLLERTEITRIYQEQSLAAANGDYLKLGQVLGADGLLFLGTNNIGTNKFLTLDLVAVKPGVILLEQRFAWPSESYAEWASAVEKRIEPLTPKLAVLARDAVPISVVNLRSAIQLAESREAERQLTLLAIERLSQEPRLFVLERRRMESLAAEKELKGLDETAFWDGSYLLDGTLDDKGYSPGTITLTARLIPPNHGIPVTIEVSGSRSNYSEVINQLADKVLASLKLKGSSEPWNAADEAEQFYAEAQWALKWNLYPQAQAAAESAWALGKRNSDSAGVLFQAYNDSVTKPLFYSGWVYAHANPDATQFALLERALGIVSQNATEFFCGTNSSTIERFSYGHDALFEAAGQMESYYYTAEARVGHEDQLAELRKLMREAFAAMNAHPMLEAYKPWEKYTPEKDFNELEWNEGGACFDRPEDALPFYRRLLERGARPTQLPHLIGWTWPDRQRVRPLLHEFVRSVCSETNAEIRLEGFYLALLLAPNDEQGSVARAEQELLSAIWENRGSIFEHPGILSLLDRAAAQIQKVLYNDPDRIVYHEPLSSFKQQLCVYFLQNAPTNNWQDLGTLLPSGKGSETAARARELLPLAVRYQQKFSTPRLMLNPIAQLTDQAGLSEKKPEPVAPSRAAEPVVDVKFLPWQLKRYGTDWNSKPSFFGMRFQYGKIWVGVGYRTQFNYPGPKKFDYVSIDPETGILTEIPFPEERGDPGYSFEISSNALFLEAGGHLLRYRLQEKTWDDIPVPLDGASQMAWVGNRLFINRDDGLIAVQPDSQAVQVLVSSRRNPPANDIDANWAGAMIQPQSDGKLGAINGEHRFTFDPATDSWTIRDVPRKAINANFSYLPKYVSGGASQWMITGPYARRYLVGFWNDSSPFQSLLVEKTRFPMSLGLSNTLEPTRWDWPDDFPLEASCILSESQKLWILCPRWVWPVNSTYIHEPIRFSDNRQATLFCFESEFRQPLSSPIHFELTVESKDPFSNLTPGQQTRYQVFSRTGNPDIWLKTPSGLIFTTPLIAGHWFIPDAALKAKFETQRQELRNASKATTKQANLENP